MRAKIEIWPWFDGFKFSLDTKDGKVFMTSEYFYNTKSSAKRAALRAKRLFATAEIEEKRK